MIRHLSRLSRLARWRTLRWVIAAPALPLALWACNANPLEAPNPAPEQQTDQYYDVNPVRDVDILFLVDNSPSMQEEQDKLNANFPVFMNELKKIPGGLPNVHIAVVSSDLGAGANFKMPGACARPGGDRGIFQTKPTCGLDPNSKFISSFADQTQNNFQGDITQVFACMANLGIGGCGYEHQLQATRVALYESVTKENAGFLRENAFLAIVELTDEDDCSAPTDSDLFNDDAAFPMTTASFRCAQVGHLCDGKQPPVADFNAPLDSCTPRDGGRLIKVSEIVDSIRALKKRPDQQILVSGIIGWPKSTMGVQYRYARSGAANNLDYAPICQSRNGGDANGGLRMKQFVESFGTNGQLFSICDEDFSPAMKQIGEKLAQKLSNTCITAKVKDLRTDQPGIQGDCQVIDRIPSGTGFKDDPIPPCTSGKKSQNGACWTLTPDTGCTESGVKMDVTRDKMAPQGTQQAIKCLTCVKSNDPMHPNPACDY